MGFSVGNTWKHKKVTFNKNPLIVPPFKIQKNNRRLVQLAWKAMIISNNVGNFAKIPKIIILLKFKIFFIFAKKQFKYFPVFRACRIVFHLKTMKIHEKKFRILRGSLKNLKNFFFRKISQTTCGYIYWRFKPPDIKSKLTENYNCCYFFFKIQILQKLPKYK